MYSVRTVQNYPSVDYVRLLVKHFDHFIASIIFEIIFCSFKKEIDFYFQIEMVKGGEGKGGTLVNSGNLSNYQ